MLKYTISILLFLVSFTTYAEEFVAGKDYAVLTGASAGDQSQNANSIVVKEFFSYGCPWCFKLEPALEKWVAQQGDKITFARIPVVFKSEWVYYAKAYYTAQALQLDSKLSPELFKAIITDKQPLNSNEAMVGFFKSHGVDEKTACSAFNQSPTIDLQINASKNEMGQYQISAIPAFIINNQYKTDLQMAQSPERLFEILNSLITKSGKSAS